jgi:hypothetical protein
MPTIGLYQTLLHQKLNRPVSRTSRRPKRLLVSMRPEKRPQTIMEQYRYREMMRQPHNRAVATMSLCASDYLIMDKDFLRATYGASP